MEENNRTETLVDNLWEIFGTLDSLPDITHKEAFKVTFAIFAFKRFNDARVVYIPDNYKWDEIVKHPTDMFLAQLEDAFINSVQEVADTLNLKEIDTRIPSNVKEYLIKFFTNINLTQGKFYKDDVNRISDGFIEKYLTIYASEILENKSVNRLALDLLDPNADEKLYVPRCGLGDVIIQAYEYHEDNCFMDYFPGEGMGVHFNATGSVRDSDTRSLAILRILLAEIPEVFNISDDDSIVDLSPPAISKSIDSEPQTQTVAEDKLNDTEMARILGVLKEAQERLYDKPYSERDFFDIVSFYGDVIFCVVPLGYKLPSGVQWKITIGGYTFEVSQKQSELFLLLRLMKRLTKKGRLGIVLSAEALHGMTETHQRIRKFLIEEDLLEAVVQLPGSLYGHIAHKPVLMIINTKKLESKRGKFAFITVKSARVNGTRFITYASISRARHVYRQFTSLLDNQIVQLEDIRLNNYDLRPHRYVSSTAKEIEKLRKSRVGRPLWQVCKFINGTSSSKSPGDVSGIPVISAKNLSKDIRDLYLTLDDISYTHSVSRKEVINEKCIVVSYKDSDLMPTIFDPEIVKKTKGHTKIVLEKGLSAIFPRKNVVDFDYLYYQLNGNLARVQYDNIRAGWYRRADLMLRNITNVDPTLSLLKKMIIPVLDRLEEQRSSAYQQKMELLEGEKAKYEALRARLNIEDEKKKAEFRIIKHLGHSLNRRIGSVESIMNHLATFIDRRGLSRELLQEICFEGQVPIIVEEKIQEALNDLSQMHRLIATTRELVTKKIDDKSFKAVDMRDIFERHILPKYKNSKFKITLDCPQGIRILLHESSFLEAIDNLIRNAEKHAFEESATDPEVFFRVRPYEDRIVIDYANNGTEFPPDIGEEEFLEFGMKGASSDGTGLGGAYVKLMLEAHKAEFEIKRGTQYGTYFTIIIPKENHNE